MRIALLSYRSKPHCGGQGVYLRHLSRELVQLGHEVEVFSGQPYPELDAGVRLTEVPSLDLYREPDPFRIPRPSEIRDLVDVEEVLTMWIAGFPEPRTFSRRVLRLLRERSGDFDIVHDNQTLGSPLLGLEEATGLPLVVSVHHPISIDRRIDLAAASGLRRRLTLRRWYGFVRMQARVAKGMRMRRSRRRSPRPRDVVREFGVDAARVRRGAPRRRGRLRTADRAPGPGPDPGDGAVPTRRSRASRPCSRRSPSSARSVPSSS